MTNGSLRLNRDALSLFGLVPDQQRGNPALKGCLWYAGNGQLLGNGDLAFEDLARVAMLLEEGECKECLVIVGASDGTAVHRVASEFLEENGIIFVCPKRINVARRDLLARVMGAGDFAHATTTCDETGVVLYTFRDGLVVTDVSVPRQRYPTAPVLAAVSV